MFKTLTIVSCPSASRACTNTLKKSNNDFLVRVMDRVVNLYFFNIFCVVGFFNLPFQCLRNVANIVDKVFKQSVIRHVTKRKLTK